MLCQCKKGVQFSFKTTEKELLQPKTRQQRQKKQDTNFVKEEKIENADKHAALAITTFVKNIRKLFACNEITNWLKLIVLVVSICSILNALLLCALVCSIEKLCVLAFVQPTIVLTKSALLLCVDISYLVSYVVALFYEIDNWE